jgi:hypothetical protein
MAERETVSDDTYRGIDYKVVRTNEEEHTSGFEYEFLLYVDDEFITTASDLEDRHYTKPWIPACEQYAEAVIDGMLAFKEVRA